MKHLKKFNETIGLSHIHQSIGSLRSKGDLNLIGEYIEWYDDKLGFDKGWKEYFNSELDKYPEEDSLQEIVQKHPDPISIIEFGQKRWLEIEKENKEDLEYIESIFDDVEDNTDWFSNIEIRTTKELRLNLQVILHLTPKAMDKRRGQYEFRLKLEEMNELWPVLKNATNSISKLGLKPELTYDLNYDHIKYWIIR
jgi:hypothetical protein